MARVKTHYIRVGNHDEPDFVKFRFNVSINVNSNGLFYAYMPTDILERLRYGNVKFDNPFKRGGDGCFSATSIDSLVLKIKEACIEASSREQVNETIVIKYAIKTSCAYCISKGDIVPNGGWVKGGEYDWKEGTVTQHATEPKPAGFQLYCFPFWRREYLYCNGRTSVEYAYVLESLLDEKQYYLKWLASICSMKPPSETLVQEIEYTEEVARFFVETYKSLCILNERIKGFLDPDGIRQIAASKLKMLSNG